MLLYEFEGKKLLKECGINVPDAGPVSSTPAPSFTSLPTVIKAQVLSGKRAESGGIIMIQNKNEIEAKEKELLGKEINGEKVGRFIEEVRIDVDKEYYLSFSYSTETRSPVLTFGKGGTGVEEGGTTTYPVDILKGLKPPKDFPSELLDTAEKLWEVFTKYDCELAEINPLVVDKKRKVWALDAKVILDDDADFRRKSNPDLIGVEFPERNLFGRPPTEREIEARKIDEGDHRGTAGSVYWDLDGDIAVLAAGGGGSVVNMDALIALGGKPANYTEHSGNPPREKLKALTKIILSKPNLKGLWIVGGTANFTDIYETLMGVVDGLRELHEKPKYPIVIRRGGPRDKEAFEALTEIGKKEGFDFHIYGRETPMTSTAKIMVDLAYGKETKVTSNK